MVRNHRFRSSFNAKDTSMGNTILQTPITPRPIMLLMDASSPLWRLSRVDTEIMMVLAVL